MRDLQWGKIAKLQDQLVHNQEKRKKQRQIYHKMLYKQELQTMINEKNQHLRDMAELERRKYTESYRSLDHNSNRSELQKRNKLHELVKESSEYNYSLGKNRKIRMRSELQEDQTFHREKYRKSETQRSEEREMESLQKIRKKKQLALAYQQQVNTNLSRKYLQKMENQRFEKLAQQIEDKKQAQRLNHINKIKYGYSQNPQAYETIKRIYNRTQEVKQAFLKKLQIETCSTQQNDIRKKSMDTIQASNYNRNYFMLKQQRKRQQMFKEAEAENRKLSSIQEQLKMDRERDRLCRENKKKELKIQLESQMNEAANKRLGWQKMSDDEKRINQSYLSLFQPISVPGLGRDHKDIKKDQIIDQFLKNKSAFSYAMY